MQEKMHMRVDEAGKQRDITQIDHLRALWMFDQSANGFDALALDENLAGCEQIAGIHLEQPRGVEDDRRSGRLLRMRSCAGNAGDNEQAQSESKTRRNL